MIRLISILAISLTMIGCSGGGNGNGGRLLPDDAVTFSVQDVEVAKASTTQAYLVMAVSFDFIFENAACADFPDPDAQSSVTGTATFTNCTVDANGVTFTVNGKLSGTFTATATGGSIDVTGSLNAVSGEKSISLTNVAISNEWGATGNTYIDNYYYDAVASDSSYGGFVINGVNEFLEQGVDITDNYVITCTGLNGSQLKFDGISYSIDENGDGQFEPI